MDAQAHAGANWPEAYATGMMGGPCDKKNLRAWYLGLIHSSRGDLISRPRVFAAKFGCSVTVESKTNDMVARRGFLSIFGAFGFMYPEVRRQVAFV